MAYPTMEAVERADCERLLRWNRYLPSPTADEQIPILNRIVERLGEERVRLDRDEPGEWTRISKLIGWDA